ncbi:hypothetical protein BDW02DRAFT_391853 [Decorospora gaudefroyi]|uniref:Uncharacterized protein n=1 Tax=Decorospora gaudefroyi TaxID=184978 RepID=A0A6A5KR58_9PLEO|nr:hypothetical protein BDW02DRAFT_391853 [Decorospora gaudefroyi]
MLGWHDGVCLSRPCRLLLVTACMSVSRRRSFISGALVFLVIFIFIIAYLFISLPALTRSHCHTELPLCPH